MESRTIASTAGAHAERALLALLDAVAHAPLLSRDYVVKGGLALRLGYGSPRRSDDLDLSSAKPFSAEVTDEKNEMLLAFCGLLEDVLQTTAPRYRLADARVRERTLSDEIPALLGSVAYRDLSNGASARVHEVKLQVTLSEIVCETVRLDVADFSLRVATLEDILAEKLKAILQQRVRNKLRPMDIYDVWYFVDSAPSALHVARIREHLEIKSVRWPEIYPPTIERYRDFELRAHSERGWADFMANLNDEAPEASFADAYAAVLSLVERLDLPAVQYP